MAHRTLKSVHTSLTERLNSFPQGAPPSELLEKILRPLLTDREEALVSLLPIKPFTAEKAAGIWKLPPVQRAMASRQMKSRYLEALIRRFGI
jgi:hypothetical protein